MIGKRSLKLLISLVALLTLSSACGKQNTIEEKRAVDTVSTTAPQPSSGSQTLYAVLQGVW